MNKFYSKEKKIIIFENYNFPFNNFNVSKIYKHIERQSKISCIYKFIYK